MKTNTVTEQMDVAQAKTALSTATKLYFAQDPQGNYRVPRRRARPLCLMGPAGIGKTEIVAQVAQEQDLALCSYSLVHHTRQSLLGLPKLENQEIAGQSVPCTRYTMSEIVDDIYKTMAKTGKNRGILFLDEFNCVNDSLRPVMLQLLQEKALGTHQIPDGWMLVLAGNPTQYNKSARDLDAVTLDRLRVMHLTPSLEIWLDYGRKAGIHPAILQFLEDNTQYFYCHTPGSHTTPGELATPRGWEDLSLQLTLMEEENLPVDLHFLGQFFQSGQLIQAFYVFYHRYAKLSASGLVNQIFARDPQAVAEIRALSPQDRWAIASAVLTRITVRAQAILQQQFMVQHLHTNLKANKKILEKGGAPAMDQLYAIAQLASNPQVQQALLDIASNMGSENGWNDITARFQEAVAQPYLAEEEKTLQEIDNALFLCNQAFDDAQTTERLLHGMVDHPPTAQLLTGKQLPAFRQMCLNTQFAESKNLEDIRARLEVS